jgi:malonyl-CoA decarboxylase
MKARNWLERMLNTVADHALVLTGIRERNARRPSESELCHRLVDGIGEASNIALAREILQRWLIMDENQRLIFLNMISVELDPDPQAIAQAASQYRARDPDCLQQLLDATEPPRQELFRRLNMAPGGTATLVNMREFLFSVLREHPELRNVEADLLHLLTSWFNRGFLQLERIDWNSPAAILEKLIRYEAVHPMDGWPDLRRRLAADRRCFAFFHPALPQDPLIFVEVALTQSISNSIGPLIDPAAPIENANEANTAVFYSINNSLKGLRGVSFGNFLIKQVVSELENEFSNIKTFVTLSPIPSLRNKLITMLEDTTQQKTRNALMQIIGNRLDQLFELSGQKELIAALDHLLSETLQTETESLINHVLQDITLFYLLNMKRGLYATEAVAHFHLSNGARLEHINIGANLSARGKQESWGCMVNYRYHETDMVGNHEAYVTRGKIALSSVLEKKQQKMLASLDAELKWTY